MGFFFVGEWSDVVLTQLNYIMHVSRGYVGPHRDFVLENNLFAVSCFPEEKVSNFRALHNRLGSWFVRN